MQWPKLADVLRVVVNGPAAPWKRCKKFDPRSGGDPFSVLRDTFGSFRPRVLGPAPSGVAPAFAAGAALSGRRSCTALRAGGGSAAGSPAERGSAIEAK